MVPSHNRAITKAETFLKFVVRQMTDKIWRLIGSKIGVLGTKTISG